MTRKAPAKLALIGRTGFLIAGCMLVVLGVVGAFLPVMPTTVFLIGATWCFARSSPRLEAWLLDHPRFGASLRAWREHGSIPRRAKVFACSGIATGFVIFRFATDLPPLPTALVTAFMLASATWIATRPE